jgi:hypothetical protein
VNVAAVILRRRPQINHHRALLSEYAVELVDADPVRGRFSASNAERHHGAT